LGKIKILIADDHAVVREGTRRILVQEPDLNVVAEAGDGEEAVRLTGTSKPDVAIIDIAMPKLDGIEATTQIKALYPNIAVLILTAYDDDQLIFSLLEAGAAGYLLKSAQGYEIIDAVRAVYAGESVLYPSIARKVLNRFLPTPGKPKAQKLSELLSEREMDILKLLVKGLSNRDIATELSLSLRTVQTHLAHIFNKLQIGSRTEAIVRALKDGLVSLDNMS